METLLFTSAFPSDISLALWVYYMLKIFFIIKRVISVLYCFFKHYKASFSTIYYKFSVACLCIKQLFNSLAFFF